ncbi:SCY1-like protein 2 [Desmophyllum pertusum]|uniref:SCY1-like protein 2 n=1 Tax=Desmophyllum pertusum TaxID=174260 RepID=A0A9W9ZY75_9CNID|nr:SCY1-like protein 2 [Desmophyllum pertusum]
MRDDPYNRCEGGSGVALADSLNLFLQFGQYMKLIKEMVRRVETEHRTKLEQLGKMQEQTKSSLKFVQEVQEAKAMDDLMVKIDKLMGGESTEAERAVKETSNSPGSSSSSTSNGATNSAEFNKAYGLPENPSPSKGASLNGNLLGVDEFSMLRPSKQNQDGPTNRTTQQKSTPPKKAMTSGSSFSAPSRPSQPVSTSSFSQPGTSSFGASMGMSTTPSYAMAGLNSGNAGMGSGMTGYTGMSGMNSGMTGLSMPGANSGMTGLSMSGANSGMAGLSTNSGMTGYSSLNPTIPGSFGINPVGSSPRYPSAGNQAQSVNAGGSTALDALFAPELEHLQNKKPSMNAMQSQQPGMQAGMNPGVRGVRPMAPQQYGGGMMTSSSGMFPMQQQPLIGGMSSQQNQYQTPRNQTAMNNRNDLQDMFG